MTGMTEALFFGLGILFGFSVAWLLGAKRGARRVQAQLDAQLDALLSRLRTGKPLQGGTGSPGEVPQVGDLREVLARNWVPRGHEVEDPIRKALGRMAIYLRHRIESPLLAGLEAGGRELRTGAEDALDALEDLEFFLEDPPAPREAETRNLVDLVQEVTREFAAQSPVFVKVAAPQEPIPVRVDPEPFKDAVFLILHNAGEFGGGEPVLVSLAREDGKALLALRDRGPGFTAEALIQAMDPFYSTSPGGLGLGLPHARKAVEAQGGEILLRNAEEGGAEVEIRLPLASPQA